MKHFAKLALLLLLAAPLMAQKDYYPYLDARAECQQADGTWSNWKHRCDLTHKRFFKDKQTWFALEVIAGNILAVCLSANHVKQGGTFLFDNHTSSGDIALAGTALFGAMLGFQRFEWYLGHDEPSPVWRETSYWFIPALVTGATAAELAMTNWGHSPGPKPFAIKQTWMNDYRRRP